MNWEVTGFAPKDPNEYKATLQKEGKLDVAAQL